MAQFLKTRKRGIGERRQHGTGLRIYPMVYRQKKIRYQRRTNAKKMQYELILVTQRAGCSGGGPTRGTGKTLGTVQRAYAV